jgi:agmatine deiminase
MKRLQISLQALLVLVSVLPAGAALAVQPDQKKLPIGLSAAELKLPRPRADPSPRLASQVPIGPVHALGEWEESEAVMTLWTNPSWVRALAARGPLKLIADDESGRAWWDQWLAQNQISRDRVSYFVTPTDSIWVRDYGPWFIVDGRGTFGIVDNKYNRPRPQDDVFPEFVARELALPIYPTGLVHTGGNWYNDGVGNGFSSTLVYSENSVLKAAEVQSRMRDFLGIDPYTTSRLAPKITIEHLDTFGKLVSPDTWVFSEFPAGSQFKGDSDAMVALLRTLKSPYGTPYRIFRMKMVPQGSSNEFRAYINSFISNRTLYYPIYGGAKPDAADLQARDVYQAALPGYEIVGVDAMDTLWGDSVHCRSRNLLKATLFLFPRVDGRQIRVDAVPTPGSQLVGAPVVRWTAGGVSQAPLALQQTTESGAVRTFSATLPELPSRTRISLYVEARDTSGKRKTAPIQADAAGSRIEFEAP